MLIRNGHLSIILISNREVLRCDYGQDLNRPIFRIRHEVDAESDLLRAIRPVAEKTRRLARRTLVVTDNIWSQIILLPQNAVQGIEPDELTEALKFETETLSGIEIDNLSLSYQTLRKKGDQQQYWVNAITKSELEESHRQLEMCGGRMISFVHPAGLTRFANQSDNQQVEFWGGVTYRFEKKHHELSSVRQTSTIHKPGSDPPELDVLSPVHQRIIGPESQLPEGLADLNPAHTIDLNEEAQLEKWLAEIVVANRQSVELSVPVLHISRRTVGTPLRHLVSIAFTTIVICFCYLHWNHVESQNEQFVESIELLQQPGRDKKAFDTELSAILENRNVAESEAAQTGNDLKRIQFFLGHQRDRIAQLLELLVKFRTPDLVIERIASSEEGFVIAGISLTGESAQAFAKRLRVIAVELGWIVNPAKQEGQQKLTSGGPWNFEILLTDIGPFEYSPAAPRNRGVQNN
jgi:hypothetical protein